jgi:hypothetical protein
MYEGSDGSPGSESGSNEDANEPSGFVKGGTYFGQFFTRILYSKKLVFSFIYTPSVPEGFI